MANSVKVGDPISIRAADWNGMLGLLKAGKGAQDFGAGGGMTGPTPYGLAIPAKNGTGEDLERFAVAGIDSLIFEIEDEATLLGAQNMPSILLEKIDPEKHPAGRVVITMGPIANDKVGRVMLSGLSAVQVDVTDADHAFANPIKDDRTKLRSAGDGLASIVYKETGTGTKWTLVLIGGASPCPRLYKVTVGPSGGIVKAKVVTAAGVVKGQELDFSQYTG